MSTCQELITTNNMKSLSVSELRAYFSEVLKMVQQRESFVMLYGKEKKPVARIVPIEKSESLTESRRLYLPMTLKMTEDEFINLR